MPPFVKAIYQSNVKKPEIVDFNEATSFNDIDYDFESEENKKISKAMLYLIRTGEKSEEVYSEKNLVDKKIISEKETENCIERIEEKLYRHGEIVIDIMRREKEEEKNHE